MMISDWLEKRFLFQPSSVIKALPTDIGLDFTEVVIPVEEGVTLRGWWVPHPSPRAALLCLQGSRHNKSHRLERLQYFHQLGFQTMLVDYRGYGDSTGVPSEQGLYCDAQAMWDAMVARTDVVQPRWVWGGSLGGAVAVDLAQHRLIDGLVIDASFSSARAMAKVFWPWVPSLVISDKFNSLDKICEVTAPTIHVHSHDDEVVPWILGRALFDAALEPKQWIDVTGPHDAVRDGEGGALLKQVVLDLITSQKNDVERNGN